MTKTEHKISWATLQRRLKKNGEITRLSAVTIVILIAMTLLNPGMFFTLNNFQSMTFQIAELGFFSCAMMICILSGGIDLSIVGIANLSGITVSFILKSAQNSGTSGGALYFTIFLAIFCALAIGAVCGLLNGFLIAKCSIPPMLATLGTLNLYTGIAIILTQGKAISGFPEKFLYFGNNTLFGVAIPMWLMIIALTTVGVLFDKTKYGFELRFYGSNPVASKFSGTNNAKVILKTYMLSGILCSIIGLEFLTRANSAKADYGVNYVFQAILCAILGGTNPNGGHGKMSGLVLALLSLQFLSSGFNMLRLGGNFKEFIWGALLLAVMTLNYLVEKKKLRKKVA